jgi:hypothetical protein
MSDESTAAAYIHIDAIEHPFPDHSPVFGQRLTDRLLATNIAREFNCFWHRSMFERAAGIWHNGRQRRALDNKATDNPVILLQTNSYIVPKDKRAQHARLVQRFRQCLARLGCDHFEAYEQVGANWSPSDTTGRFVQLMRFRDRKHQLAVQAAERSDQTAQALIKEFCELINFPYQQQQGLFAVGFYHSLLPAITLRTSGEAVEEELAEEAPPLAINPNAEPGQPPEFPTVAAPTPADDVIEDDEALLEEIESGEPGELPEGLDEEDEPIAPDSEHHRG